MPIFFIHTFYSPPNKQPFCLDLLIQFEYVSQHLVFANCIPLILKFFNQNILSYITAKNRYGLWTDLFQRSFLEWIEQYTSLSLSVLLVSLVPSMLELSLLNLISLKCKLMMGCVVWPLHRGICILTVLKAEKCHDSNK